MYNNFIFDYHPFKRTENEIFDHVLDGCKIDIKYQINIISDIILHIYNNIGNINYKKYFCIYGADGTGKSFILKEIEKFLIFRKENVLFLNHELFTKSKKKLLHDNIIHKYVIFDDFDKIKDTDKQQLKEIIDNNPSSRLIFSSHKHVKRLEIFSKQNTKIYKLCNLSLFETYYYVNRSINMSYALNTKNNRNVFSILSIFIIYIFSMGKLSYINNISTFCLNLFIKNKVTVIPWTYVFKYVRNNLKTVHNVFKLFFRYFVFSVFTLCVAFMGYQVYLNIHKAKFNRIRQEIELQNLRDSL